MSKINCWEFKKCGREPGGVNVDEFGVCPATVDDTSSGINKGNYAGRLCWAVAGTFCGGDIQGDFAAKAISCMACDFFKTVKKEEGPGGFVLIKSGQSVAGPLGR